MKTIIKILALIFGVSILFNAQKLSAQDRYGYATFKKYDQESRTRYLVISDPVRNWYHTASGKMTDQEKEAWIASYKTQANRQTGTQLMSSYEKPVPHRGDYVFFTSESACKEAITKEINEFNRDHKNDPQYQDGWKGGKNYYKVIYVYPSKR